MKPIPRKINTFNPPYALILKKANIEIKIPRVTNGSIRTPMKPNLALLIFVFNSRYTRAFMTFF